MRIVDDSGVRTMVPESPRARESDTLEAECEAPRQRGRDDGGQETQGVLDAVITAGGRLSPDAAAHFGTDVKALVRVNGKPMLATVVDALRATPGIGRIVVVGPSSARAAAIAVDRW